MPYKPIPVFAFMLLWAVFMTTEGFSPFIVFPFAILAGALTLLASASNIQYRTVLISVLVVAAAVVVVAAWPSDSRSGGGGGSSGGESDVSDGYHADRFRR